MKQKQYYDWLETEYLQTPGLAFFGHKKFPKAESGLLMHDHGSCMEIVFLIRGRQDYYIEDTAYSLIGGQAFIAFPNQPHKSAGICQDVGEIYWFQLDLSCTENFLGFHKELSQWTIQQLLSIKQHVVPFDASVKNLLQPTYNEFCQNGPTPLAVSSFMHLIHQFLICTQKKLSRQDSFLELEQYIENHISEKISMETLCQAANISLSTLQHTFKMYFGRSPAEYINFRKIQRSKELLLAGKTITETAMLMGFNTSDYYSTVFRKFNGMSPSSWLHSLTSSKHTPPEAPPETPHSTR